MSAPSSPPQAPQSLELVSDFNPVPIDTEGCANFFSSLSAKLFPLDKQVSDATRQIMKTHGPPALKDTGRSNCDSDYGSLASLVNPLATDLAGMQLVAQAYEIMLWADGKHIYRRFGTTWMSNPKHFSIDYYENHSLKEANATMTVILHSLSSGAVQSEATGHTDRLSRKGYVAKAFIYWTAGVVDTYRNDPRRGEKLIDIVRRYYSMGTDTYVPSFDSLEVYIQYRMEDLGGM
jgi:hypothetical protein